uniref:Putative secreted protein n=1 Tax=Anopheles darlingi TaxID=43151 RepID=A0A2M4DG23_ANODA
MPCAVAALARAVLVMLLLRCCVAACDDDGHNAQSCNPATCVTFVLHSLAVAVRSCSSTWGAEQECE